MSGTKTDQYARNAKDWSDRQYADPQAYLEHRAQLIVELGPALVKDDEVLDLACGDGGLGEALLRRGLRYRGLDLEPAMVEAAARRLGDRAVVELGDLNTFALPSPVAAITVFRAIYYAVDRPAFFARAREQTRGKLVFDLNPRQYRVQDVSQELRSAGFEHIVMRPFFVPQTIRLPRPLAGLLSAAERIPLAAVVLRVRFTYLVAAW
jgi:SAM-dependent methyltransferase